MRSLPVSLAQYDYGITARRHPVLRAADGHRFLIQSAGADRGHPRAAIPGAY